MAVLKNPKHEAFAQAWAKTRSASEASRELGLDPRNSTRMTKHDEIRRRVDEIQGRGAERAAVTIESLIKEAADIQAAASRDGQYSAATAALTAKAKLAGLWVEKTENRNQNFDANSLSDSELAAHLQGDGSSNSIRTQADTSKLN